MDDIIGRLNALNERLQIVRYAGARAEKHNRAAGLVDASASAQPGFEEFAIALFRLVECRPPQDIGVQQHNPVEDRGKGILGAQTALQQVAADRRFSRASGPAHQQQWQALEGLAIPTCRADGIGILRFPKLV